MKTSRAQELLLISKTIRNYGLAVVIIVWAVAMLYIMLSPADELPPVKDTRGGIPVYDYASIVASVIPLCDSLAKGVKLPSSQYEEIEAAGFDFDDLCKSAEKLPATANN